MARNKPKIVTPRRRQRQDQSMQPWLLYGVLATVVIAVLASAAYWFYAYGDLKILDRVAKKIIAETADAGMTVEDIYITGRQDLSRDQLLAKVNVKRGTPLLAVDPKAIQARIMELPPVHQVSIQRLWPNRLFIKVEERVPIALWQKKQILFPIDRDGVMLTYQRAENFSHLPVIVGEDAPPMTQNLLSAIESYPELKAQVKAATYVSGRRWDLYLKNNMMIKLPDGDVRMGLKRLMRFANEHLIFAKPIAVVDLRLPDRVVLKPSNQPTAPDGNINPEKPQI
jgi:cell division protein FtsQ